MPLVPAVLGLPHLMVVSSVPQDGLTDPGQPRSVYRDSWSWNAALSALWFANNYKWFILLLFVLPAQVAGMKDVPPLERDKYWGFVFMAGALWAFVGPALLGGLSDRLGRRRIFLVTGSVLTVVALGVLAGVGQFWWLAVGYLFLQVSDDVIQGAYGSLIPQIVPPEKQAKSSAVLSALNLFAQIATAIVAQILGSVNALGLGGIQWIYVGIAVVQLLSLGTVLIAIRRLKEPIARAAAAKTAGGLAEFFSPWKSPDFRWVWISRFAINLGYYIVQPYLQFFLDASVGRPVAGSKDKVFTLFGTQITGTLTAMMIILLTLSFSGAVGALISSRRMERWGLRKTIWFAGACLAPVLLVMAFTRDYTLMFFLAIFFGFAHGHFLSADWALGAATVPNPDSLGKDMGIWNSAVVFAQVLAGNAGAGISALNGVNMGLGYSVAFIVSGVFMFLGAQLVWRVKGVN